MLRARKSLIYAAASAISAGLCLLLATAASAAPPSLSVVATDAVIGQTIHAAAQLSEAPSASGEISFEVFGPGDPTCSGPALTPAPASASVGGEGEYTSGDFTPSEAGIYHWSAHYSGDLENPEADSTCSALSTVSKASPGLSATASGGGIGGAIHDEATVTGGFSPSGEVVFTVYAPADASCLTPLVTEAVPIQSGTATAADFLPQQAGEFRWTAAYAGDGNNEPISTPCGEVGQTSVVAKASPSLTGAATSAVVGSPITDSVTLAGGFDAVGNLVFRAYGPGDTTCGGAIKYESTLTVAGNAVYAPPGFSPSAGSYRWTVEYEGDANNEPNSLPCGAANQSSSVAKASPTLAGVATSAVVGSSITDKVTLAGGFNAGGEVVFRAYGPGDTTCATKPKHEVALTVTGNGVYSPPGFSPAPGLYRWTVEYEGDANNETSSLPCNAENQGSAVGTIAVVLAASAGGGTVGVPISATASIQEGAIPGGQITFKAFSPGDTNCSGAPAFASTIGVAGNGSYRSAAFVPTRVGTFRWTVSYSGDANHSPATVGCGKAAASVTQTKPSITSAVVGRLKVGSAFQVTAVLQGAYAPTGTVTFRIYGPDAADCAKPLSIDTVAVVGSGTASSDPFVAHSPGHYTFVASYSGDVANQGASESCDPTGRAAEVEKRTPRVRPRARLKGNRISILAHLSGAVSPSGVVSFRLYRPGDRRCKGRPAFSGGVTVKSNGSYLLAQYFATKPGTYRLGVGYSGDQRNRRFKSSCRSAQPIRIR